MSEHPAPPLLQMRGINKSFAGNSALEDVNFTVQSGEIHALIGQNGAGKSTLMKVLAGVHVPDSGSIAVDGVSSRFRHPEDALQLGIGVVYQDLSLVPQLSVADNVFLGKEPGSLAIARAEIRERTRAVLDRLGLSEVQTSTRVNELTLAQQQLVAIGKVLAHQPRLLVLDEPTAPLGQEETVLLLDLLRDLRKNGVGIVYISHRFKEITTICDRATVLRNGKVVADVAVAGTSEEDLVELTLGATLKSFLRESKPKAHPEVPILTIDNLSVPGYVDDISFELNRGEILGLTGLLGAGQNELARALYGLLPATLGSIRNQVTELSIASPTRAIQSGIALITDKRKREGLVLPMSVRQNISLASLNVFRRLGIFLDIRRERQQTAAYAERLQVKAPSLDSPVGALSGGNQQKAVLAKWMLRDSDVLVLISPTQGIDVGARAEIYRQLSDLASAGKGILVVSEDHLEILSLCDRILVMREGQITDTLDQSEGPVTEEALLSAIQGLSA